MLTHSLRLPLLVRRPLQEQLQESHLRRPPLSHHQTVSYANVVRCPKALLSLGHAGKRQDMVRFPAPYLRSIMHFWGGLSISPPPRSKTILNLICFHFSKMRLALLSAFSSPFFLPPPWETIFPKKRLLRPKKPARPLKKSFRQKQSPILKKEWRKRLSKKSRPKRNLPQKKKACRRKTRSPWKRLRPRPRPHPKNLLPKNLLPFPRLN